MTDLPPFPTDRTVVLSPRDAEHRASLGSPMVKAIPSVPFIPKGFTITNISVFGNTVTLSWQGGQPPFQVQANTGSGWIDVGLPTTAQSFTTSISPGVKSEWFRLQSDVSPVLGRGTFNCPEKIIQLDDGRYAYPFSDSLSAKIGFWTGYNDFVTVSVPGFSSLRNPCLAAVGDRLVLSDSTIYGTNRLVEFQLSGTNLTTVKSFGFGTSSGTVSCVVDGLVFVFSFTPTVTNHVLFTSLVRNSSGDYSSITTNLEASTQDTHSTLMTTVGFHGIAWLFNSQDGGQCISLTQFTSSNTVLFASAGFIPPNQGDLSCNQELPIPTSCVDSINDVILLGYCSWPEDMTCIAGAATAGRTSITSVDASRTLKLLGTTPWWSWHSDYPLACVFPRGILIDTITENVTLDGCDRCNIEFDSAELQDGAFHAPTKVVGGCNADVAGFHPDGWFVYRDSNLFYRLGKL